MGKAVNFCPSLWGGKDWPPEAWNPKTKLFYIPANNHLCSELPKADEITYKKGDLYIGYPIDGVLGSLRYQDGKKPNSIGELQAWDLNTGKMAWVAASVLLSKTAKIVAFSVAPGIKIPPSLRNILQEAGRDVGLEAPTNGSLTAWAQRGVLLINTCWSVEQGQAGSHAVKGWDALTDEIINAIANFSPLCVYMLWGAHAQSKALAIEKTAAQSSQQSLVLQANHPSPLSARRGPRPFVGCGHFSLAQSWLRERGVNWRWDWALTPQDAA
jgi:uracil-DNA glycosylase